jgi:Zn-dependent peptidase ImmA (M78 family)/DNA-binding XRE family transcriptional regulator
MNEPEQPVTPAEIGERLRLAREEVNLKQSDAAHAIGAARTTIVAIEQGQRKPRTSELQQLAKLYRTSVNALLRQEAVHVELSPRFRKLPDAKDDAAAQAVQLLADLAKAEVELENLLGIVRVRNYPPERPIMPGDVRKQAEQDALELRQRLGLGLAPIPDIVTLLEMELGIRVYIRKLPAGISGLFVYDEKIGACMLLNANHPRERRSQTASHEAGHFISIRREPEILHEGEVENSREERYAIAFARTLLTPARAVMQKFKEVTVGAPKLTRRHVILLAHFFGVSREFLVRRLEELGLTKEGTWDWFVSNGNITDEQARQVLGDRVIPDAQRAEANRPTTLRLNLLAEEAHRRELLSEAQLARLLHVTRVEMRAILEEAATDDTGNDDGISLE